MSQFACDHGCFVCGPEGQRRHHSRTGCCGSTVCDESRWRSQIRDWLRLEEMWQRKVTDWLYAEQTYETQVNTWLEAEYNYGLDLTEWLQAESVFLAQIRAKPKTVLRHKTREEQRELDPAHTRRRVKAQTRVKARQR
jgi:hypothetical protein